MVGREHPGLPSLADRPGPGLGPLGGLSAAVAYAANADFDAVLASGCDLPDLPRDAAARLGEGPAVAVGLPLVGVWPAALAATLDAWLPATGDRSLRGFAAHVGARRVDLGQMANVNYPHDLARLANNLS